MAEPAIAPGADVPGAAPSTAPTDTVAPAEGSAPTDAVAQDSTPTTTVATEPPAAGQGAPMEVAATTEPSTGVVAPPSDAIAEDDAPEAEPQPDAQPDTQPDAQQPTQPPSHSEQASEPAAAPQSEPTEALVTEAGEPQPQAAPGEGRGAEPPAQTSGDGSGAGDGVASDHVTDQAGQAAPTAPLTNTSAAEPSSAAADLSEPPAEAASLHAAETSTDGSGVAAPATGAESGDAAAAAASAAASPAAAAAGSSAGPTPAMLKAALSKLPSGVDPQQLVNMLFADESSDDEEFVGFAAEDIAASAKPAKRTKEGKKKKKRGRPSGDGGGDDGERSTSAGGHGPTPDNDYEAMLMRRKLGLKRRRKDGDRTDLDEFAKGVKDSMFDAAEEDKVSNEEAKPATKKLQLLPKVVKYLSNTTMQLVLIENGVLQAVAAWLQPMPDRSLPSVQLRTQLIHVLEQLPDLHNDDLKDSGLGKACMLLLKHPKETPANRAVLQKLVQSWARMVFKLHSDYKHVRLEDRMERDRMVSSKRPLEPELQEDDAARALRPGDAGFVWRARVPQPRMRDYVDRPVSNVDAGDFDKTKKQVSRLEKLQRRHREGQLSTQRHKQHAVGINMSGSFAGNKN